jgi:SOS-response transcriptional repressor LexA
MSRLGTLIRGMRIAKKWDLESMASALGTTASRLRLVESGAVFPPAVERRKWGRALGFTDLVDLDRQWRDGWARVTAAHRDGWIPIINKAPAGLATDYLEYGVDSGCGYDYVARSQGMTDELLFAVIVIGDSMSPVYREGDLVIFRPIHPDQPIADGSPVFVRFTAGRQHGCTFKSIYHRSDGRLELRPENPSHRPLVVGSEEIDRMALAIETRPQYWIPQKQTRRVRDEYVQEFPEET